MASTKTGLNEVHILWTSGGLSCNGDTVSLNATRQPRIDDILLGLNPRLPKVHLHNTVLAYETGDQFVEQLHKAARGELDPFVLVLEGSISNAKIKGDGHRTSLGNDPITGQPIPLNDWIDKLAPRAWATVAVGTCATSGGIHAMADDPTGCIGLDDYLGWDYRSTTGIPIVNIPGSDKFRETLLWLLQQAAGDAPMNQLNNTLRPTWLFGKAVHDKHL